MKNFVTQNDFNKILKEKQSFETNIIQASTYNCPFKLYLLIIVMIIMSRIQNNNSSFQKGNNKGLTNYN